MMDICNRIDEILLGLMPGDGIRFHGLCQPVIKGNQTHPVTVLDKKQVSIDSRWDAICFHRLNGTASITPSDEQDFGRSLGRKRVQPMRTFIAHKVNKGEEWIDTFINNIPAHISLVDVNNSPLYEFIDIGELSLLTDQVSIYNEEFGDNNYEKHIQNWNVYALEYSVEFIRC